MTLRVFVGKCLHRLVRLVKFALIVAYSPFALILYCARVRFNAGNLYNRIGHLALEPDCYLKTDRLGWHKSYRVVFLHPADTVVNEVLFHYWRQHYTVISHSLLCYLLYPLSITPFLRIYLGKNAYVGKGEKGHVFPSVYWIARKYEEEFGAGPMLKLPEIDIDEGWRKLGECGMPHGAWFVCLHVREVGYLPELNYHSYRDADILSYIPAIEAIVERGGWVVRIGDHTMKPLPALDCVIDLTQGPFPDGDIDIFCLAQCKFAVGTTSGPIVVPYIFGVPTALTNWVAMGHGGYGRRDTWIPKLYWSETENRYLTFAEIMSTPRRAYGRTEQFEADGISVVDNTPEEIRDLCLEVMDLANGQRAYDEEDKRLQGEFESLLRLEGEVWTTEARVGRDFLRKHKVLFE
jgi:putative glycosyltransferase (TIGR04372 family)